MAKAKRLSAVGRLDCARDGNAMTRKLLDAQTAYEQARQKQSRTAIEVVLDYHVRSKVRVALRKALENGELKPRAR